MGIEDVEYTNPRVVYFGIPGFTISPLNVTDDSFSSETSKVFNIIFSRASPMAVILTSVLPSDVATTITVSFFPGVNKSLSMVTTIVSVLPYASVDDEGVILFIHVQSFAISHANGEYHVFTMVNDNTFDLLLSPNSNKSLSDVILAGIRSISIWAFVLSPPRTETDVLFDLYPSLFIVRV